MSPKAKETPAKSKQMTIGALIRRAREGANVTQEDMAAALGVGQTTVSGWESGRYVPRRENLRAIAAFLEIDVAKLAVGLVPDAETGKSRAAVHGGRGSGKTAAALGGTAGWTRADYLQVESIVNRVLEDQLDEAIDRGLDRRMDDLAENVANRVVTKMSRVR